MLEDGRVRELYKATGGAWGGTKVDEAFVSYFCEMFTKEVIDEVKQEHSADWVETMREFEKSVSKMRMILFKLCYDLAFKKFIWKSWMSI